MKNVNVYVLANNPLLRPYAQMIKKEADKAVRIISKYIPLADVDITIANRPYNIVSGSISMQVENKYLANIAINVEHKHFKKFFRIDLLEALAYVLYRMVRIQKIGYSKNLLEDCVEEGLSYNFQTEVVNDKSEPYFMSFKNLKTFRKTYRSVALRAKKEFYSTHYSHEDWFDGSKKRSIPQFTGYIIGYAMVKHFLKVNSHLTPSKLIEKKAKYFDLRESK